MTMLKLGKQIGLVLLILCAIVRHASFAQSDFKADSSKIATKLFAQKTCWNNGDIDCFMETYWKSDSLKFIGKDGITYGWQATKDRYKKKYPDAPYMGYLLFEILEMESLGINVIMMVGKWHVNRKMGDLEGHFTLIWKKIDGKWVIVSDHTS